MMEIKQNQTYVYFKIKNKEPIYIYIYIYDCISGNGQRKNYALTKITNPNTFLYYLDDDNILHPNLYKLLDNIEDEKYIRLINIIE